MTRTERLKEAVAGAFDRAGDLVVNAALQRRSVASITPGSPAEVLTETHDCRVLWDDLPLSSDAWSATDLAPLERRKAFLESPDLVPRSGDRLVTAEKTYVVLQARSADAGQGILHRIAVR